MQATSLLIRGAEFPDERRRDVRIFAGVIAAIDAVISPRTDERVVDAHGNALLRGLNDHHLHLFAAAAALGSVVCGPPAVQNERELRRVLQEAPEHYGGWIRGVAFHESVCATIDRHWLDSACPDRPVRVQHRSGMLWVLNTRALESLRLPTSEHLPSGVERDASGGLTGRFYALDAWLGARIGLDKPRLSVVSAQLASFGVTGVTDAGARNGPRDWRSLDEAQRSGELLQRVLIMGDESLVEPDRPASSGIAVGPLKIYLRESDLPALQDLVARFARAHEHGRRVAVHCVTRVELAVALAAFEEAGVLAGDRLEHVAICDDRTLDQLAALPLTVVTQPHFIAERGSQYLDQVDPEDIDFLYRASAFLRRGVRLAAGSDAPYGGLDPWAAMRAATTRQTRTGEIIGAGEALPPAGALALYGGGLLDPAGSSLFPAVGDDADLCLLDVPWRQALASLDAKHVALTMRNGRIIYATCPQPGRHPP